MSIEGVFGIPQVNNSNKGDGAMLQEFVVGTLNSAGELSVYTQLEVIEYHTLSYMNNAASKADAIDCEQPSGGVVTIYGTASAKIAGMLCGRSILQD